MDQDTQPDPQNPPRHVKEDGLPRVEADEPALVVGLQYEKQDSRDNGEIGQHSGYVVSHPRGRAGGRDRGPALARRTRGRAIGNLCTTHIAKCHLESPSTYPSKNPGVCVRTHAFCPMRRWGKVPENDIGGNQESGDGLEVSPLKLAALQTRLPGEA